MIVWILIPVLWIAFFSLILHDATKDDPDGGAVFIAAKTLVVFLNWGVQKLRAALRYSTSILQYIFSSSNPIQQGTPSAIAQAPARPPKKAPWRKEDRVSIAATALELAIAKAVKAAPGCEDFIGVIVRPKTPRSRLDPNWEVRGVRFGNADRKIASELLATVLARFQQEFRLTEHHQGDLPGTAK
jgi:hypothetical protein